MERNEDAPSTWVSWCQDLMAEERQANKVARWLMGADVVEEELLAGLLLERAGLRQEAHQ